ncbi:hypothetical protein LMH87_009361 [Akanthomyces muscarius]|uniref:N-alkane-inducible cytochrome P450 n=1 Tax=Akanthomyces muscarius TaxID=2231603 RepID=A0A9W8QDS0_AKAMU|nr:hypothetical protein LMH87_009361 [Akanthomyces muscarius]KAJ4152841.1 hypothetical protein LMH87_009361 [Akanthomyces muscarius]
MTMQFFLPTGYSAPALLVVIAGAFLCIYIRRVVARARFAQLHGCRPVAKSLSKDPFLGLDALPGTIRSLVQHKMLEQNCELFNTYGNTFTLKELHRKIILTIEPENIKTVLSLRFSDFGIGHRLAAFKPLLGEGIFDTDGDHWASSRALVRPSFTRDQLADLSSLECLFQDLVAVLPRDGQTVVDLQPLFFCYTLDSATEFLFGQSAGTLKTPPGQNIFAQAFQDAQRAIIARTTLGWLSVLYRDRKASEGTRICRDFAARLVDEAFETVRNGEKEQPQHKQGELRRQKYILAHELASRTSDRKRVLDELMNVLLAGRDTTASLLSNLFFVLAQNPTIWEKLRREVSDLGQRPPTYEELRGLEYVQCCLNESLRLHPVVPRNQRQALCDTVLPLGGGKDGSSPVFVRKGTFVAYNIYAMHRRTDIYGPDAAVFRPERWREADLRPRWGYLPFNGGPRVCLGQRYALTEAGYVLVRMVQHFQKLESRELGPWEESLALTLCSRNGTKVSLVPV